MKTCDNCGNPNGVYRVRLKSLLCSACDQYHRRTGQHRPYRVDGRKAGTIRGSKHYAWKGDAAQEETKRQRARRRYQLGRCELCGQIATERHHRDDDTGNNAHENIMLLCRRCHMESDGRLLAFVRQAMANSLAKKQPPKPCVNCGRLAKPRRKGRCYACDMFFRRHGREWTEADIGTKGRLAKAIIAGTTEDPRGN